MQWHQTEWKSQSEIDDKEQVAKWPTTTDGNELRTSTPSELTSEPIIAGIFC